jgi:heme-degrading monooxygenase HmoA
LTRVARSREAIEGYWTLLGTFSRGGGLVFVTVTEGRVSPEREDDLRSAWEETAFAPAGLIQSTLVRGEDGTWRIITFWESRDAVMAMRASGEPPALTMFLRAGSQPSVSMGTVERQARE